MNIFRKKSIDRISDPEQLYDYIHVTTPPVWVALLACILLLAGVAAWCFLGRVEVRDEYGAVKTVAPIEYVIN